MIELLVNVFVGTPLFLLNILLRKNRKRRLRGISESLKSICRVFENESDFFVSYRLRPKNPMEIKVPVNTNPLYEKCAIVIQGPLVLEEEFTLKTALLYRDRYPSAHVIVSTWDDADKKVTEQLIEEGIDIVLSKLPDKPGRLNINYQIVNTRAGIQRAKEEGCKYICKTRSDQRIYSYDWLGLLLSLLAQFPPNNDDFAINQKERIVFTCMNYGDMFYPFLLSDFFYFGHIDDIERLFSIELDERNVGTWNKGVSFKQVSEGYGAPEIQIIRKYIERSGGKSNVSVKNYWNFVKKHAICINKDMIGLYWEKYDDRYSENSRNGYYHILDNGLKTYNFDFSNWICLYTGVLEYKPDYEKYTSTEC